MMKLMVEAPEIYCPKEERNVPVWWCLGSFIQKKAACPEMRRATIIIDKGYAEIKCKAQKRTDD